MSDGLPTLASTMTYRASAGAVSWEGRLVSDKGRFADYMRRVVAPTLRSEAELEAELRGLARTGMATQHIERLLRAAPRPLDWEIGEALAEVAIASDLGWSVRWPWRMRSDRRSPRASLPGADLIGFVLDGEEVRLLIGEIKTSSDIDTPPRVLRGSTGMVEQLELNAKSLGVHLALLDWLRVRCIGDDRTLFEGAVSRYLDSAGHELALVGALLRDTPSSERDLARHGKQLAQEIDIPTRVRLVAWYLPVSIAEWPQLCMEAV